MVIELDKKILEIIKKKMQKKIYKFLNIFTKAKYVI